MEDIQTYAKKFLRNCLIIKIIHYVPFFFIDVLLASVLLIFSSIFIALFWLPYTYVSDKEKDEVQTNNFKKKVQIENKNEKQPLFSETEKMVYRMYDMLNFVLFYILCFDFAVCIGIIYSSLWIGTHFLIILLPFLIDTALIFYILIAKKKFKEFFDKKGYKEYLEAKKQKEAKNNISSQKNKIQDLVVGNCYICNAIAEDSCNTCGKFVCKDHLTILEPYSYCTPCIDKSESIYKKIKIIVWFIMIGTTLSFILYLYLTFT